VTYRHIYEGFFGSWPFKDDNSYVSDKIIEICRRVSASQVENVFRTHARSDSKITRPLLPQMEAWFATSDISKGERLTDEMIKTGEYVCARDEAGQDSCRQRNYWRICPEMRIGLRCPLKPGKLPRCERCGNLKNWSDAKNDWWCACDNPNGLYGRFARGESVKSVIASVKLKTEPFHYEEPVQAVVPDDDIPF